MADLGLSLSLFLFLDLLRQYKHASVAIHHRKFIRPIKSRVEMAHNLDLVFQRFIEFSYPFSFKVEGERAAPVMVLLRRMAYLGMEHYFHVSALHQGPVDLLRRRYGQYELKAQQFLIKGDGSLYVIDCQGRCY